MKKLASIILFLMSFVAQSQTQTLLLSRQDLDQARYRYRYITAQKRCSTCATPRLGYDLTSDTLLAYLQQKLQVSIAANAVALNTATVNANTANTTANTASTNASTALSTANTANTNASTALSTANSANTNASTALSTANTANTNANTALSTANSANTNASTALSTATTASTNASAALSTANTANTTANTASTNASTALSTANTANTNSSTALSTANTASTNASTALSTANTALSSATTASTIANNAINAVTSTNINAANAINAANVANTTANSALSIANSASLQGVRLGGWNANTNTPTLSADASAISTGGYYDVTVQGTSTFSGQNFAVGQLFSVGERIAKTGSAWYRIPYSIAENSIGIAQTNFINKIVGKNKFNKLTATDNFYVGETGGIGASATYTYSDFIPVKQSTQYYANGLGMRFTCYYDANKTIITGGSGSQINTFTTTANTYFVRITIYQTEKSTFQLEEGTSSSSFSAYEENIVLLNAKTIKNSIGNPELIDNSVSPEKTNFLVFGKNKFNQATATDNFYVGETGGIGASSTYSYSDFIPVKQSTQYYANGIGMRFTCYYDANKTIITGGSGSQINTFTTTANTYFVRITIYQYAKSTFQLEEGSTGSSFEKYGYTLDPSKIITSSSSSSVNIAIAPKLYTLNNSEIAIYYANIHKVPESFLGKSEIAIGTAKQTGQSTKFIPTSTGETTGSIQTANEDFDILDNKSFKVISVNPTNTTAVKVLNFGDSYTYARTFTSKLSSITSNVTFLGIRTNPALSVQNEGRGGYTLLDYFTLQKTSNRFSPFMQPSGSYKFYGVTGFWKLANVTTPDYEHADYGTVKSLFNATTGYLISPVINSIMYDDVLNGFYVYNGSAWVTIAESTLNFSFNFAKYRTVWNIDMPNIIHVHLGTNDWYATSGSDIRTDWNAWKTNLDAFIASAKADNANVKIIVGIPNSSGKQGGLGVLTTEKSNRNYWIHAKNIITNYSGRESENIHVADYHSIIDREYGFANSDEVPYSVFTGTYRNKYMADFTHLSVDGFNQMGNMYAAMIQFLR